MSIDELSPVPVYIKTILLWLIFTCSVGYLQMTYVFEISHLKPGYFMAPGIVGLIFGVLTGRIILLSRKLKWCSIHDPLTQAYNHGHYQQILREWSQGHTVFSLILIDIDHFKGINDKYGHKFGDDVLVHICELVRQSKRSYDVFARHGGEEFVLLTPRTDLAMAADIANRLCKIINSSTMPADVQVSCSFGVAQSRPDDTADTLFNRADKALYDSKRNGRNRVSLESAIAS